MAQAAGLPYDTHLAGGIKRLEGARAADRELTGAIASPSMIRGSAPMQRPVCLAFAAVMVAVAVAAAQPGKERTVNVYNWTDYIGRRS